MCLPASLPGRQQASWAVYCGGGGGWFPGQAAAGRGSKFHFHKPSGHCPSAYSVSHDNYVRIGQRCPAFTLKGKLTHSASLKGGPIEWTSSACYCQISGNFTRITYHRNAGTSHGTKPAFGKSTALPGRQTRTTPHRATGTAAAFPPSLSGPTCCLTRLLLGHFRWRTEG